MAKNISWGVVPWGEVSRFIFRYKNHPVIRVARSIIDMKRG
jgi:hypothetical protein